MKSFFSPSTLLVLTALVAAAGPAALAREPHRAAPFGERLATPATASRGIRAQATAVGRAANESPAAPAPAPTPTPAPAAPLSDDEFDEFAAPEVYDPFERVNRAVFTFNDRVYRYAFRPVARGYRRIMPAPARRGIGNFFENVGYPVRFTGSLLQAKPDRALRETGKFLVNSTAGFAGFLRVSDQIPALANVPPEDIGQTFARWGVAPGPFLVLPIVGPTTLRDGVGRIGDSFLTPTNWDFLDHYDWTLRASLQMTDVVNGLPDLLDFYDSVKESAVDPYLATRSGFVQYRETAARQ